MKIDQPTILNGAIELLNQTSLDALSMRMLANHLDVKAASLYFHIKNKNELMQLISESISERIYQRIIKIKNPDFFQIATITRDELKKIHDSPRIFEITDPFTPYRTKLIELAVQVFKQMGVPAEYRTTAGNLGNNYVLSFVSDEQYFASVPNNQVPAAIADQLASPIDMTDPDKAFEYGLNVIIAGFKVIKY